MAASDKTEKPDLRPQDGRAAFAALVRDDFMQSALKDLRERFALG